MFRSTRDRAFKSADNKVLMFKEFLLGLVGLTLLTSSFGCSGSLSPLYADFRIDEARASADSDSLANAKVDSLEDLSIQKRISDALIEVGWELDEAPSENAVSTSEVEIVDWGLYDVRVSLDVVPINQKFVRVFVHPYRQYFFGSRSKMSYMNRRVRSYVLPDLTNAFRARGIVPLGEPRVSSTTGDGELDDESRPHERQAEASRISSGVP